MKKNYVTPAAEKLNFDWNVTAAASRLDPTCRGEWWWTGHSDKNTSGCEFNAEATAAQ